jgi:protein-S-isoprenylcysteine O-methyltransferase Ste14
LVLLILLAAAVISIVLGVLPFNTEDSSAPPWLEGVAILVVIVVQIFVSVSLLTYFSNKWQGFNYFVGNQ